MATKLKNTINKKSGKAFCSFILFTVLSVCFFSYFLIYPSGPIFQNLTDINGSFVESSNFKKGFELLFRDIYSNVYEPENHSGIQGEYSSQEQVFIPENQINFINLTINAKFVGYQIINGKNYYFTNITLPENADENHMKKLIADLKAEQESASAYITANTYNNRFTIEDMKNFELYPYHSSVLDFLYPSSQNYYRYSNYRSPRNPPVVIHANYIGEVKYWDALYMQFENYKFLLLQMPFILFMGFVSALIAVVCLIISIASKKTVPFREQLYSIVSKQKLFVKIIWALALFCFIYFSCMLSMEAFLYFLIPISLAITITTIIYWLMELSLAGFKEFFKNSFSYKIVNGVKNDIKQSIERSPTMKKISYTYWLIVTPILFTFGVVALTGLFGNAGFLLFLFGALLFAGGALGSVFLFVKISNYVTKMIMIVNGTKVIASGNLNYEIETIGLKGELLSHATAINSIKDVLNEAVESEVKSQKMKTELITNVSHDLKTPLTSIINYVDLLSKENLEPDYANDYVKILNQKALRLKELISDLFEAAKASSGDIHLNMEHLDLCNLLNQTLAEAEQKIDQSELDFKVSIPNTHIVVNADGSKLWRVIDNLIGNAIKYSLRGTRVYVDLKISDNNAEITFKNISAYELNFSAEEITERFKRGDEARSTEGSGLGLAIAKSLTELMGGQFDIMIDGDLFKVKIAMPIISVGTPVYQKEAFNSDIIEETQSPEIATALLQDSNDIE